MNIENADKQYVSDSGELSEDAENLIVDAFQILALASHRNSAAHGFHDNDRSFGESVALVHSEVSEALEEWRKGVPFDEVYFTKKIRIAGETIEVKAPESDPETGDLNKPEGVGVEYADAIIRMADGDIEFDLGGLGHLILLKHRYNLTRPYKHGKLA